MTPNPISKRKSRSKRRPKKVVSITAKSKMARNLIPAHKSSQATARLIRRFHTLNKELSRVTKATDPDSSSRVTTIHAEMERLGGLDAYQRASQLGQSGTRGGSSSKWLVAALLDEQGFRERHAPLRLLDVGAVSPDNYAAQRSWIAVTSIDLNPQHPRIARQDFLKMRPPKRDEERFDIVCLSLVLNFVGDPIERGQMLAHTRSFLYPLPPVNSLTTVPSRPRLLYLVLPLPCITNSRYFSHDTLLALLASLGYYCKRHHHASKLAYYLLELTDLGDGRAWPKRTIEGRVGGGRNNFCVVMKGGLTLDDV